MTSGGLEAAIRRAANRFGLDIHRHRPETTSSWQLARMLAAHRVDVVVDVGANVGQFALALRHAGFRGRIVSFEPLPSAHDRLREASRRDPLWDVAPAMALGDQNGEVDLNIAGNSVSSSVLGMLDAHALAAPDSRYASAVRVPLRRLDDVVDGHLRPDATVFLKVDTQGYEDQVLSGAPRLLGRAVGVQLELSLVPLYAGQRLYDEMLARMSALGLSLWSVASGFVDPRNGRMLQVDATFFRAVSGEP